MAVLHANDYIFKSKFQTSKNFYVPQGKLLAKPGIGGAGGASRRGLGVLGRGVNGVGGGDRVRGGDRVGSDDEEKESKRKLKY